MLSVIKEQLLKIIDDIDCGNSNISEEDAVNVIKCLKKYTRKDTPLSKAQAYTYLNISRATFDNLIREGKLPKGKKQQGFKELFWFKKDLNKYIQGLKENK
jgi:predicted DNA-binding transcriptional regulator AlpA